MDEEQDSGSDLELEEDWEAVPTVGTHAEAQDGVSTASMFWGDGMALEAVLARQLRSA